MYGRLFIFAISALVLISLTSTATAYVQIDPAPTNILDNGVYVPYKLSQDLNSVTYLSKANSFVFDKNSCTISFFNKDNVSGSPLIGSDSYQVLASFGNSGVWSPVSVINNAACNTSVNDNSGTVTITGSKSVSGAGVFSINYTKPQYAPLKLSFSATNNNPSWTNYHIGMRETVQVPSTVTLGDSTYDLTQYNNTVLGRTWINTHKAQLIQLTNNARYDMGIGWNNTSQVTIHYIGGKTSLDIDYTYNTPILSPGQTITVDPSITVDTTNSIAANAPGTSQTLSFTVGSNSNRMLIVGVSTQSTGAGYPPAITGVTYNGVAMTNFTSAAAAKAKVADFGDRAQIYYMINPPTGAHNIVASYASGPTSAGFGALSIYNVDQTIGITNGNFTVGNAINPFASITPTHTGAWVFAHMSKSGGALAMTDTSDWNNVSANPTLGGQHRASPTIGSVNRLGFGPATANEFAISIAEIIPFGTIPATPSLTNVNTLNSTAIQINFASSSSATWYIINYTTPRTGTFTQLVNQSGTSYTATGLTPGTQYAFKVEAGNANGTSPFGSYKSNYTFNVAPTSPTISGITSSQARLSWTNPSPGNLTGGFKIFQVTPTGTNYTLAATTSNSTNHRDFTSLQGNRQYTSKISTGYGIGTNVTGYSSNSTTVSFYTLPGTPTGLTITQLAALQPHLTWTQAVDNGTVLGSKIERSNDGGSSWTTISGNTGNATAAYTDTVATAGTYSYRVSTIKYGGTSSPSTLATRTIWNDFTFRGYHADGTTAVYGQAIQTNSTSSNNRFTLVSGQALIHGISGLNNFTAWNSLINFIVGKQYNYNATANHSLNMTTADFDVDCPSTGTGTDVELFTNGTNGHRISAFTTPTCFANNTMNWSTTFTANGNDVNSYSTLVYVRVVNATFGAVAPLKYNSTMVTTAFGNPYIISDPITVGKGTQTRLFNWSMNLTVSPAFTPVNFTVGHISVSGVNPVTVPIKFTTTPINSTATSVMVTFPSTYTMAYQLTYGNEGTSQILTGLPVTSPSLGLSQSTITFRNPGNDFVTIKAYDTISNTTASTILSQPNSNIPFVTQFKNFKNGLFGTSAMIGGINIIDLIVLIVAMIGLNRANEIVGAFMMVIIVGVAAFFEIITWPTALISAIALATLVTVVTMKKYQNS